MATGPRSSVAERVTGLRPAGAGTIGAQRRSCRCSGARAGRGRAGAALRPGARAAPGHVFLVASILGYVLLAALTIVLGLL